MYACSKYVNRTRKWYNLLKNLLNHFSFSNNLVIQKISESYSHFTSHVNNIDINYLVVFSVFFLFILLHYLRNMKVLKQLSIFVSFFPVLVHELGHAFAAQLTGGYIHDIRMVLTPKKQQALGSQGYALTSNKGRLSKIITIFCGYLSAPLMLILSVYFITNNKSYIFILLSIFFMIFYFAHTKQKWLPLLLLIICLYFGYNNLISTYEIILDSMDIVYSVLIGLLLGESVQSIITTAKVTFVDHDKDWDGALLKQYTLIPASVWWLVWTSISLYSVYFTINYM